MDKLVNNYKNLWKNWNNFSGRTTCGDFWWTFLANLIVSFVVGFVSGFLAGLISNVFSMLASLYVLAVLIPSIALVIRRLHDTNKSGWYYFVALIPLVGGIILLVFLCSKSVDEGNKYGPVVSAE